MDFDYLAHIQVQVYYDANQIITDVLAGKVDIGFLESGIIEAYIWFDQSGSLSMSNFTVRIFIL